MSITFVDEAVLSWAKILKAHGYEVVPDLDTLCSIRVDDPSLDVGDFNRQGFRAAVKRELDRLWELEHSCN